MRSQGAQECVCVCGGGTPWRNVRPLHSRGHFGQTGASLHLCVAASFTASSSPFSGEDVPELWSGSFWGQFACSTSIRQQGHLWLLGMVDFLLQMPD